MKPILYIVQETVIRRYHYTGISQSRNRGHQNAVLAGLMEAKEIPILSSKGLRQKDFTNFKLDGGRSGL